MKLLNLRLENFKGIKSLNLNLDGKSASIYGTNATGKTTIADAVSWLLFDKSSTEGKSFSPKPRGRNGEEIHHVDSVVEGIFLTDAGVTADIIRAVDSSNIKMLCDLFHMQLMHGDLTTHLLKNLDIMDYIHIADAPGRGEPGTGELNYGFIVKEIKKKGFDGVVCFEITPQGNMEDVIKAFNGVRDTAEQR